MVVWLNRAPQYMYLDIARIVDISTFAPMPPIDDPSSLWRRRRPAGMADESDLNLSLPNIPEFFRLVSRFPLRSTNYRLGFTLEIAALRERL